MKTLFGKQQVPLVPMVIEDQCNHPGCADEPVYRTLLGIPFCRKHFVEFYTEPDSEATL